ncbi:hypothetical protein [Paractinoplanes hotanensis]|uniref:Uncharacterized protein n=1 Tax=Paractinoplanes hotanensis TaxID=2906497 RepID=A0ABT0XWD2_9ACTN|nr:hypothetical protein [Actinoplanes hotanensis]MCM4078074.1 hypothetical protein [Actinoplanes hotanensis]
MTRILVTAAAASYAVNAAFGTAVAAGVIDNRRIRWVHHALFSATASLTVLAVAAGALERRPAGLALLPALGPLTALPYAGGRIRRHAALAGSAAPAYAAALVSAWRSH